VGITCIFVFYNTIVALNISHDSSYNDVDWDCYVIYEHNNPPYPAVDGEEPSDPIKYRKLATDQHNAGMTVPYPFWYRGPIPLKPDGWMCLFAAILAGSAAIVSIINYVRPVNTNNQNHHFRLQMITMLLWGVAGGLAVGAMWAVDSTITMNGGYPPNKWTFFDRICDGIPRSWYSLAFWLVVLFWSLVVAGVVLLVKVFLYKNNPSDHVDSLLVNEGTPLLSNPQHNSTNNGSVTINLISVNK